MWYNIKESECQFWLLLYLCGQHWVNGLGLKFNVKTESGKVKALSNNLSTRLLVNSSTIWKIDEDRWRLREKEIKGGR